MNKLLNNWRVVWWDDDAFRDDDDDDETDEEISDDRSASNTATTFRRKGGSSNNNNNNNNNRAALIEAGLTPTEILNRIDENGMYVVPTSWTSLSTPQPQRLTIEANEKSLYLILEATRSSSSSTSSLDDYDSSPAGMSSRIFNLIREGVVEGGGGGSSIGDTTAGVIGTDGQQHHQRGDVHQRLLPSRDLCHLLLSSWLELGESLGLQEKDDNGTTTTTTAAASVVSVGAEGRNSSSSLMMKTHADVARSCQDVLEFMLRHDIPPLTRTVDAVMVALSRVGNLEAALEAQRIWDHFFEPLKRQNQQPTSSAFTSNIEQFDDDALATEEEELLTPASQEQKRDTKTLRVRRTLKIAGTLLSMWSHAAKEEPFLASRHASSIVQQIHEKILPSSYTVVNPRSATKYRLALNSAMACHIEAANATARRATRHNEKENSLFAHRVIELFDLMEHHQPHVQTSTASYRMLLAAYGHLGYYQQAKDALIKYLNVRVPQQKATKSSGFGDNEDSGEVIIGPPVPMMFASVLSALAKSKEQAWWMRLKKYGTC